MLEEGKSALKEVLSGVCVLVGHSRAVCKEWRGGRHHAIFEMELSATPYPGVISQNSHCLLYSVPDTQSSLCCFGLIR